MEAERIVERSGQRDLVVEQARKAAEKAIWGAIWRTIGGVGGIIGGILFPSEIGRSDRPLDDVVPRRFPRRDPILEKIQAPTRVLRDLIPIPEQLREIVPNIPRRRDPIPTRTPTTPPKRLPQRAPRPLPTGTPAPIPSQVMNRIFQTIISGAVATQAIRRTAPRSIQTPGSPFIDPVFPPQNVPLTPSQPVPLPSPNRFRTPNFDDLCRANARKQRKKRRKCKQRENVVWAGGPKKGKIAGTKCATFEDTF